MVERSTLGRFFLCLVRLVAPESCLSESCHQFDDELVLLADFGHGAGAVEVSLVVDADVGGEGLEQAERQAAGGTVTPSSARSISAL